MPGPQKQAKGSRRRPQNPARGRVETEGLQTSRSRARQIPEGCQEGRFSCPLRGRVRPEPPKRRHWLPPSRGPLRLAVWAGPPRSSPSRPGQPSVRRSRIPSTHSVFRLPPEAARERDRKFGQPPTHTPTFSPPGGAGAAHCGVPTSGVAGSGGLETQNSARGGRSCRPPPPIHSFSLCRLRGLRSPKNRVS